MGNKSSRAEAATEKALLTIFSRKTGLTPDMFGLSSIGHHGVPSNAKTIAFCGLQGILAVGTASGCIKLYGNDNLEILLEAPKSQGNLTIGVTHMKFTGHQRLLVAYTDSSIRVFDLAEGGKVKAELRGSWTTYMITCIETISYLNFQYIFVATDDGNIHVIHEETAKVSMYAISPRDVGLTSGEGTEQTPFVTAMAMDPRDANHLLIAYEFSPVVYLWDFAKRKVIREFTLAKHKSPSPSHNGSCNSPLSLSWHSSGKRFVAGYKFGGFGIFRVDKDRGYYHTTCVISGENELSPVKQVQWLCAPPNSKHSHLPGAILISGGQPETTNNKGLTIVYPRSELSPEDAISELVKSERLVWQVGSVQTPNNADVIVFETAHDQVDYCSKIAPLSVIMLSGNPLDGCLPSVSVQCLPCFVRFLEGDKEDWQWNMNRMPEVSAITPLLQLSPLKTFTVVNLMKSDGALQDDLFSTWEQEKHDPLFRLLARGDFEWPINGGTTMEPLLKGFFASSDAVKDETNTVFQNGTMLLTGHQNGYVLFWELIPPAERASKGTLHLLHVIDVPLQMDPIPENKEISCITFCHSARVLVVGFTTGEMAVFEFGQWKQRRPSSLMESHFSPETVLQEENEDANDESKGPATMSQQTSASSSQKQVIGFRTLFNMHVHNDAISKLTLSTVYGYVAVADCAGVVSLVHLATQSFKILIFDLPSSSEDSVSVDSLLMSELVQVTDIPTSLHVGGKEEVPSVSSWTSSPSRSRSHMDTSFREVVPVLYVGRGSGKLEMFHVQSATKMGETLVDPKKSTSLSSIIMVDADGKRIGIPGRVWVEQGDGMDITLAPDIAGDSGVASDSVNPEIDGDTSGVSNADRSQPPPVHVRSPSTELEYTKQVVMEVINELSNSPPTDTVIVKKEDITESPRKSVKWSQTNIIEVLVPPGSLGVHLFADVEQHAVVKGFVPDNETAAILESRGIRTGHAIMSINGLDMMSYDRSLVCAILEKFRDREKNIIFAEGFLSAEANIQSVGSFNDLLSDGSNYTDIERPRFLVCTCGRLIHILQAVVPKASEIASGPKEMPAQPLATVELRATISVTSVIRVPVGERVENCLAVIDQSNHMYILSLLSLEVVWQSECFSLGNALDGIQSEISYGGELIVVNEFGEIERFSFFSEHTAMECAMLERKCIKTKLHLQDREYPFEKDNSLSPKKKGLDASKMFKKLVGGLKDADLNKLFQSTNEEIERSQLIGDRPSSAKTNSPDDQPNGTKKISGSVNQTKDALMQAGQHLQERGEKLSELQLKTEQMKHASEDFYKTMKAFNEKNANKKWYEF